MKRLFGAAAAVCATAVLLTACETVTPRVASTISVTPSSVNLLVGETANLQTTVRDQHGEVFTTLPEGVTVSLSSSNTSVVTVSGMQVTAVGAGTANVTVSAGGATPVHVPVTVGNAPTTIQVSPTSLSMQLDQSATLAVTILDQDGNPMTSLPGGFQIAAASQNTSVATVNNLTVHAVGTGSTTVNVTAGNLTPVAVPVTVTQTGGALEGTISFDFSGDASGSFGLTASFDLEDIWYVDNDWAFTVHDSDYGSQDLIAMRRNGDGTIDFLWLWGSADGGDGPVTSPEQRTLMGEYVRRWNLSAGTYQAAYWFEEGTITFSSVSAQRIAGSFQGTGVNLDSNADLTMANGSFDLPILAEDDVWGITAPSAAMERIRSMKLQRN